MRLAGAARTDAGQGQDDAGYGLAELLVTMTLTSLLLLALGGVFLSDVRTTSRIIAKVDATADVRLAIDTAGRRLRVATDGPSAIDPVFVTMEPRAVVFYASLERSNPNTDRKPDPSRVSYDVVPAPARGGQCFRETVTSPMRSGTAVTYPSTAARTIALACGAIAPAGTPIFTYYGAASGTTIAATSGDVRSVGIDLAVGAASGGQSAVTSAGLRVGLPNTTFAKETS